MTDMVSRSAPTQGGTKRRLGLTAESWEKVIAPLVLGVLGLALLLGAFLLYPRRTELPTPLFTQLELTTTAQINLIAFNVDAHRFYRAHGFERVATLEGLLRDGDDELLMRKRLTP